jgi:1-acyl-sn-glycerol-3-phosphate acyltransferase
MPLNVPVLGPNVPQRGNVLTRFVAQSIMRLTGWRFEGAFPDLAKFVIIVAPHTSNWDFFVGIMAMFAAGFRGTFLGKHTLFRWPTGIVMRWLGGVPVDRSSPHNVVEQVVAYFRARPAMMLALSPEGTRKKLPAWRTGFYNIAKGAGVPIMPVAFDFPRRTVVLLPLMHLTDDRQADFARLGGNFTPQMAYRPSQY